jgi:hypothetical protein
MFQTNNQIMGDDLIQLFFLDIGDNQFFGWWFERRTCLIVNYWERFTIGFMGKRSGFGIYSWRDTWRYTEPTEPVWTSRVPGSQLNSGSITVTPWAVAWGMSPQAPKLWWYGFGARFLGPQLQLFVMVGQYGLMMVNVTIVKIRFGSMQP